MVNATINPVSLYLNLGVRFGNCPGAFLIRYRRLTQPNSRGSDVTHAQYISCQGSGSEQGGGHHSDTVVAPVGMGAC